MPLELAVAAGALLVLLLLLSRGRRKARPSEPKDGLEHARRFVDSKIEQHLGPLTAAYVEGGGAEGSGAFAREIESFIGSALMRERAGPGDDDAELWDAVREVLVLDRESVYRRVRARVEEQLAQAPE